MAFSIGMWVRDTALKLRQQGIELDKLAISKIGKSNGGIYTNNMSGQNPWQMQNGRGGEEDLTWLIK
jgi:hypothetical protein